jgi:hypothetical protein
VNMFHQVPSPISLWREIRFLDFFEFELNFGEEEFDGIVFGSEGRNRVWGRRGTMNVHSFMFVFIINII